MQIDIRLFQSRDALVAALLRDFDGWPFGLTELAQAADEAHKKMLDSAAKARNASRSKSKKIQVPV